MEGATTPTLDLVEHGRRIGLLPRPGREESSAAMLHLRPASDADAWLRGGSETAPAQWPDTPIAVRRPGYDAGELFVPSTPTTTDVPSLRTLGMVVPGRTPVLSTRFESATTLVVDPSALVLETWRTRPSAGIRPFLTLVSGIREAADLTIEELAHVLGRSRKQYYNWLKKGTAPRDIQDRVRVIADVLRSAGSQPPQRIKAWLLSAPTRGLLAEADLTGFVEEAGSWTSAVSAPKPARRLAPADVAALAAADEPGLDEDELASFFERSAQAARRPLPRNPNFYRDLSSSPDDDE